MKDVFNDQLEVATNTTLYDMNIEMPLTIIKTITI